MKGYKVYAAKVIGLLVVIPIILIVGICTYIDTLFAQTLGPTDSAILQNCSSLRRGLVGYWRLEESSGTRYDCSVTGAHLTSVNAVGNGSGVSANTMKCASFVATSSQQLTALSSNTFNFSSTIPFSLSFWIKSTNTGGTQIILAKLSQSGTKGWQCYIGTSGQLNFYLATDGSNNIRCNNSTSITNEAWHHIVCTYDGSKTTNGLNVYLDGSVPSLTFTKGGTFVDFKNTDAFSVGSYQTSPTLYYRGLIDEIAIWTNVISSKSVTRLYNSGLGTHFPWSHP